MTSIIHDKESLRDTAYKAIRDDILSEKLVPGERLMEKHLADKLGISRTPVREALSKLEQEGFVHMSPRRGATVSIVRKKDIEDVLKIRTELEVLAVKLACENIDMENIKRLEEAKISFEDAVKKNDIELMVELDSVFHDVIFALSGNNKLTQILNNLREQIFRYRMTYLKDKNYRTKILNEHGKLFDAIKNKDTKIAQKIAKNHIQNQEKAIINNLDK